MANVSSSNGLEKRPKLRFPGFDEPWNESKLSACFAKNTKKNTDGRISNVICNSAKMGLIPQRDYFDKDIANSDNTSGYYIIEHNDFVYNPRKSSDAPYGPISRYAYPDAGIVSPLYLCFRAKGDVDTNFFEWYFRSSAWHRYIYMTGDSGARHDRVSIKDDDFFSMPIRFPSSIEQKEIASFLNAIERRISSQQLLVDNLKKYKRGVFEAIFSRTLRLMPRTSQSEWTAFKLSDFATRITRKNNGATDIPLTISAQYGLIDQRDFFSKVVASTDMSGYYLLHRGEYAYNRSTSNDYPFGSIKRLDLYDKGAVSTLYLCFAIKEEVVLSDFARWYFESSQWYRGVNEICAEGARNHGLLNVPTDGFFNTVHILPSDIEEQSRIAAFLSRIHEKVIQAQEELEELNSLRKGLMQQLFI
jgi:type I restriction enzyme S subunit